MSNSEQHKQLVKKLLDAKVVDFAAIGKAVADLGPSLSLADDVGDPFCGVNRIFIHIYTPWTLGGGNVENLGELAANAGDLRSRS